MDGWDDDDGDGKDEDEEVEGEIVSEKKAPWISMGTHSMGEWEERESKNISRWNCTSNV